MMPYTSAPIVPTPPAGTLTNEQSSLLMTDLTFRGRIKVCCLVLAKYILEEPVTQPAHNTRTKWAQRAYQMPDTVAMEAHPPTVMEPLVQTNGSEISDKDLQTSVENALNKLM